MWPALLVAAWDRTSAGAAEPDAEGAPAGPKPKPSSMAGDVLGATAAVPPKPEGGELVADKWAPDALGADAGAPGMGD